MVYLFYFILYLKIKYSYCNTLEKTSLKFKIAAEMNQNREEFNKYSKPCLKGIIALFNYNLKKIK